MHFFYLSSFLRKSNEMLETNYHFTNQCHPNKFNFIKKKKGVMEQAGKGAQWRGQERERHGRAPRQIAPKPQEGWCWGQGEVTWATREEIYTRAPGSVWTCCHPTRKTKAATATSSAQVPSEMASDLGSSAKSSNITAPVVVMTGLS